MWRKDYWKLAKHVTFGTKEHGKQEEVQVRSQVRLIVMTPPLLQWRKIANVTKLIQKAKKRDNINLNQKNCQNINTKQKNFHIIKTKWKNKKQSQN